MNHLAHARLAGPEPIDIAANLMGDFVRGRLEGRFAPRVEAGLRLHRAVDSFTDAHPVHARSRARLDPPFRRYAGILVDIYYDHFLARHFSRYSELPLESFTARVYRALLRHRASLPRTMRQVAAHWRREDRFAGYADLAVIDRVMAGLATRLKRDNPLAGAGEPLRANYLGLEEDFLAFFPDLLDFARGQRGKLLNARTAATDP